MPHEKKKEIIEEIELEVCGFGSTLIALREFRRASGNTAIQKLFQLREYLTTLSDDALIRVRNKFEKRLKLAGFPQAI